MRLLRTTSRFEKDFRRVPRDTALEAKVTIDRLLQNPLDQTLDIKKLKGFTFPLWRVRIGSYRLFYTFDQSAVTLHRFRHRKDVYR